MGRRKTHREQEVADLVCEGLPNKEIGVKLGISERTVKNHLSSLYHKRGWYGYGSRIRLVHQQLCEGK
jgi:DNA-binding NarL/FixJ family response regulator